METNHQDKHDNIYLNNTTSKKKNNRIWWYIAILLLLAGVGITSYYFYKKNEINRAEEQTNEVDQEKNAVESLFTAKAYDQIPYQYKQFIYHYFEYNKYLDGTYFLTKIEDRAPKVFAFADFTSDDNEEPDLAVVTEYHDFKSSRLIILNHRGELLFVEDFDEIVTIESFKVGSKIYINDNILEPAPNDGIIVKEKYNKFAVVYDKATKKFEVYYQYSDEEIETINNQEMEGYEGDIPEPSIGDEYQEATTSPASEAIEMLKNK